MRRRLLLAVCCWMVAAVCGQIASRSHFEVASVKPAGDIFSTVAQRSGGRIRWTTQLCYLIGYAYNLDSSQVSSPKCGSIYAVDATFDPLARDEDVRLMTQSLLADRFKMQAHMVTTQASGYSLSTGRGGVKLREVKAAEEASSIAATMPEADVIEITGRSVTISQLATVCSE
jgi:uncharacterized protein (TIGR03435 family)